MIGGILPASAFRPVSAVQGMLGRRDRFALAALIGLSFIAAFLIANPYDPEGALDAYIYSGYTLSFAELINRYGPYYFSYRIAHLAPIWFFRTIFGDSLGFSLMRMAELAVVFASIWAIFRPHLPRLAVLGLGAAVLFSPWMLKTVSTLYVDGVCVPALFGVAALLVRLARTEFAGRGEALAIGLVTSLICNANLSLLPFVALLVAGFFLPVLGRIPWQRLAIAALAIVVAGAVAQLLIYVVWAGLVMTSGTPASTVLLWTRLSLEMTGWDYDMFSFVVGRAMAQSLSAEPTPEILRMLRSGEVSVLAPLAVIPAAGLYRVWAFPLKAQSGDAIGLRRDLDGLLLGGVMTLGYATVSTETLGNHILNVPYYLSFLAPSVYLCAFASLAMLAPAARAEPWRLRQSAVEIAALLSGGGIAAIFALNLLAPNYLSLRLEIKWIQLLLTSGLVGLGALVAAPLLSDRLRAFALMAAVGLGSVLFLSASSGYYRNIYQRDLAPISRDILDAQRVMTRFVNSNIPSQGAAPNGTFVLFWHSNSPFVSSVQSGYVANNTTLHLGGGSTPLPNFDQRAIDQLAYGTRRYIVMMSENPEDMAAGKVAIERIGGRFTVLDTISIAGDARSLHAEIIRIDQPPPQQSVEQAMGGVTVAAPTAQ